MKIAVLSDLHGILPGEDFFEEDVEILMLCGDIFPLGVDQDLRRSELWLFGSFEPWCKSLPVEKIIWIAGNHDFYCEAREENLKSYFSEHGKITYLCNSGLTWISENSGKTYDIWGTPYCHKFGSWAFMRSPETLEKVYSDIPKNLDILLCHDAPLGVSDKVETRYDNLGCPELRKAVLDKQPRYLFHGHLHTSNHGEERLRDTRVYNTSLVDESYSAIYKPLYIYI